MKKIIFLFAIPALILTSCMQDKKADDKNSSTEHNKKAMLAVTEMFNTGNLDSLEVYVAENFIDHSPDPNIKSTGLQMFRDLIPMYRASFPDLNMSTISITAEGDLVTHHFNMKGTNSGAMGEMPATNKAIDVNGVDIVRFENGKGVEHWGYFEESKFMTQLGMMPDPHAMPADSMNAVKK